MIYVKHGLKPGATFCRTILPMAACRDRTLRERDSEACKCALCELFALPGGWRARKLREIATSLPSPRGPMSNPRQPLSLTTAAKAGRVARVAVGMPFAGMPGIRDWRNPHPIPLGITR